MATVYLTYARHNKEDAALAQALSDVLRSSGHEVILWETVDYHMLPDAKRQVQHADKIIVIFSSESYASYICYVEIVASLTIKRQFLWRTQHIPTKKIIPISYREKDGLTVDDIFRRVNVAEWQGVRDIKQAIKHVRDEVNRYDWIDMSDYRTTADAVQRTFRQKLAYQELMNAVVSMFPTWRAFLSYAREDSDFILPFRTELENVLPIWFDQKSIPPGNDWQEEIYKGIDKSHNFLFVVSIAWLTSPNCHREYDHAHARHKRLVAVILEEFDEDLCRKHIVDDPWLEGDHPLSADKVIEKAQEVWALVQALPENQVYRVIDQKDLAPLITHLVTCFEQDRDYINQHTEWLLRARDYADGNGRLLDRNESRQAKTWLEKSQHSEQRHPPTPFHHQYIEQSVNYWHNIFLRRITVVLLILLAIGGLAVSAYRAEIARQSAEAQQLIEQRNAADARADAELTRRMAAEQRAADAIERLQLQAIYNEMDTYPLHDRPTSRPVSAFRSIWVSQTDGMIRRQPINGLGETILIPTYVNPDTITVGHGYLWVNNRDNNTLTRIDPLTNEASVIDGVGTAPLPPLFTDDSDWVWVQSERHLTRIRIDLSERVTHLIGLNNAIGFNTHDAIWYLDSSRQQLMVVDSQMDAPEPIALPDVAYQAIYYPQNHTIFVVSRQGIFPLNVLTRQLGDMIPLPKPVEGLIVADSYLWGIFSDKTGILRLDPHTMALVGIAQADVAALYPEHNRLWTITQNTLTLYQVEPIERLATIETIGGVRQLQAPVSDGRRAWFTHRESGTVFVIDELTGDVVRDFALCTQSSRPIFDGANMWFGCLDAETLLVVPADIRFFGEGTILSDSQSHQPIVVDNILWLSQQATGRIIAFDLQTEQIRTIIDVGRAILPLMEDAPYLWTATVGAGDILRIDTRSLPERQGVTPDVTFIEMLTLDLNISNMTMFDRYIWVGQLELSETTFLNIIDRETFTLRDDTVSDRLIGGGTLYNGLIWGSTFGVQQAYIIKVDPATGAIISQEPMPETRFASPAPVFYDELLWFMAVVPPPSLMASISLQMAQGQHEELPFYLIGIDPYTDEVITIIDLPTWADFPYPQGRLVWLRMTLATLSGTDATQLSGGIMAVHLDTSEVVGIWSVCDYDSPFYFAGDYVWLGCRGSSNAFGVILSEQTDFVQLYTEIGQSPNPPVIFGDYVVFTFAESNTLGVFDVASGELQQVISIGRSPQRAIVYEDSIWVYNAGSDTLQRVQIDSLAN